MGFWYCGQAENFIIFEEVMIRYYGWRLGGAYQEELLEALVDGALFNFDVADDEDFEKKLLQAKLTISRAVEEWEKPAGIQLRFPL